MYDVSWTESAINELANMWIEADAFRRHAISNAVAEIDRRLERDPLSEGESRERLTRRVVYVAPIAVEFEVSESKRRVIVGRVWPCYF